eukprot:TRINITY_DN780111_c0_g1_i1.p1 TRINITY_DN780111_c0_g1~~TRINITY_DN780111_c0_g1_i1.p1  ORF type:complete len:201 (-),score=32.57 TRINITY_DN780111_c0_g1_i1:190-792(-)
MQNRGFDELFKVIVLGETGIGKTGICERFVKNKFDPIFTSTIGLDFLSQVVTIDKESVLVHIWDTSGQERFHSLTSSYYRGIHGVILCYDTTDEKSILTVKDWLEEVNRQGGPKTKAAILVGTKSDLPRKVPKAEGQKLADELGIPFFETSAKTSENIELAFVCLVAQWLKIRKEEELCEKTVHVDSLALHREDRKGCTC